MRNLRLQLAGGLLALSTTTQTAAQTQPTSQIPTAIGPWSVQWDAPYCTASIGNIKELALSIWYVPGSSGVEIYFIGESGYLPPAAGPPRGPTFGSLSLLEEISNATGSLVQMADGERPIPVTVLGKGSSNVHSFAMTLEDFLGNFPSSNELLVQQLRQPHKFAGLRHSGASEAMTKLQRCIDGRLKEWGVDSAALSQLKRRPQLQLDS